MNLILHYHLGAEKNQDTVTKARENIKAAGLLDRVILIKEDIFQLEKITEKFDYVLAEAILTRESDTGKVLSVCDNGQKS